MHTYRKTEDSTWTVGFETAEVETTNHFRPIRTFTVEYEAACFASFLNGGAPVAFNE